MHVVARELRLEVPSDNRAIESTCKYQRSLQIETATHDIVVVDIGWYFSWKVPTSNFIVIIFITTSLVRCKGCI